MFHLARRGASVLGLDRFSGGHDRGSSHGQTRIIRQAYFEHSDYVPLLLRAYQLWAELEELSQSQLYVETGLLEIGPPDGVVIPGVIESAEQHSFKVDRLSNDDVTSRFPGFVVPDNDEAVFEQHAGYLHVEKCVLAHLAEAQNLGVTHRTDEEVLEWDVTGATVRIVTNKSEYETARLVITAGAWARDLLAGLGIELKVFLKHLHWYDNNDPRYVKDKGCPTFFYEIPAGYYYGFPAFDERGLKVAEHSGGQPVSDPLDVNRSVDKRERKRVEHFLSGCLPGVGRKATDHTTCFYTLSPDEHFIVDRHPEHEQVVFAAGLSGHGFKFTGVLGEVLADLSLNGKTNQPIDFLNCQRSTLRQTNP